MKTKFALTFALVLAACSALNPALAQAKTQSPAAHQQHGSSFHDRSPRLHIHESQPHH